MITLNDNNESLNEYSVWRFPKQDTSFDNAFRAAQLFNSLSGKSTNVEKYFVENFKNFGVNSNVHRVLTISQMYGLITRTPFYHRSVKYSNEKVTEVFKDINSTTFGSNDYNCLKSEQLLKIKMRAIIDTTNHCVDWNILAIIYSYYVLKTLKSDYNINRISLDNFYTYVMTCNSFNSLNNCINFLRKSPKPTRFLENYKSDSRFINVLIDNINLFKIENGMISINSIFYDYFNYNFVETLDINSLNKILVSNKSYSDFLYYSQNFNVNIIDSPTKTFPSKDKGKEITIIDDYIVDDEMIEDEKKIEEEIIEDEVYLLAVDKENSFNIDKNIAKNAFNVKPDFEKKLTSNSRSTNPKIGKIALLNSNHTCEIEGSHVTFKSSFSGKQFMEVHHLIPISYQKTIWKKYRINIDCIENIVSLCPNCHRKIHLANNDERISLIEKLYELKITDLKKIGIEIPLDILIKYYTK